MHGSTLLRRNLWIQGWIEGEGVETLEFWRWWDGRCGNGPKGRKHEMWAILWNAWIVRARDWWVEMLVCKNDPIRLWTLRLLATNLLIGFWPVSKAHPLWDQTKETKRKQGTAAKQLKRWLVSNYTEKEQKAGTKKPRRRMCTTVNTEGINGQLRKWTHGTRPSICEIIEEQ